MEIQTAITVMDIVQVCTIALLTVVGWGVRAILKRQDQAFKKIEDLGVELRTEMQQYIHKDTCLAHREGIIARIESFATCHHIKEIEDASTN